MLRTERPRVEIVGAGVVGQAFGRALCDARHAVHFVDTKDDLVDSLRLQGFDAWLPDEAPHADVSFLCVQTPMLSSGPDYTILRRACEELAERINTDIYRLVVVKSTVLPGTTRNLVIPSLLHAKGLFLGKNLGVCVSPEYFREKYAFTDAKNPKAVIIGEYDAASGNALARLFSKKDHVIRMSMEEAEFHKFVHNLFNATKISFFNEMRGLAAREGYNADLVFQSVVETSEAMWNSKYGIRDWGPFDGQCLPNDVNAFIHWTDERQFDAQIVKAVRAANRLMVSLSRE